MLTLSSPKSISRLIKSWHLIGVIFPGEPHAVFAELPVWFVTPACWQREQNTRDRTGQWGNTCVRRKAVVGRDLSFMVDLALAEMGLVWRGKSSGEVYNHREQAKLFFLTTPALMMWSSLRYLRSKSLILMAPLLSQECLSVLWFLCDGFFFFPL